MHKPREALTKSQIVMLLIEDCLRWTLIAYIPCVAAELKMFRLVDYKATFMNNSNLL